MSTSLRRSKRLQQRSDHDVHHGDPRKQRPFLPSPSMSSSFGEQRDQLLQNPKPHNVPKEAQFVPKNIGPIEKGTTKCVDEIFSPRHKRKRTESGPGEDLTEQRFSGSTAKRTKFLSCDASSTSHLDQGRGGCQPIQHWASTGVWPENFSMMSQERSDSSRKRPPSYSQSTKDGDVPRAHSQASEKVLADHGVYMSELEGRALVRNTSKVLIDGLQQKEYDELQYTLFSLSNFLVVWQRAQNRNEARIFRDITSVLVPSPELLYTNGHQDLEYITEEISAEWTKGKTLGGPRPKPDLAIGISHSAFTEEELVKLKNYTAFERPTLFTENLYFPFLLCEAKCGNEGINRADRQNMHSSSMAVNAVIQLSLKTSSASYLSGQVLVFSISHDNEWVKIYGHFAVIREDQVTFHRVPVISHTLNFEEGRGRKKISDFVQNVYHKFYPEHIKRIQAALAEMDDPRAQSMTSKTSIEEIESQELDPSAPSSQDTGFKKPNAPNKKQKGEIALLREELARQEMQRVQQMAQQENRHKEHITLLERQLAQQNEMLKRLLDQR